MKLPAIVLKLYLDIRASYWFLPAALVVLAVLLSQVTLWIDQNPDLMPFQLPEALRMTQLDGARALMTIISQSVFGVAGVMFSMTIVAVTYASGNFGPRLIRNFMKDRGNQWSLGILIATFVFALMITRGIQSPTGDDAAMEIAVFVPHLSILFVLVLTFLSVFTVIFFVHHIPETINVSNITATLGRRLIADLKASIDDQGNDVPEVTGRGPQTDLKLNRSGYVQALNIDKLMKLADDNDLFIAVNSAVGSFVSEHTVSMTVQGGAVGPDLRDALQSCIALGNSKTEDQNPLFIVDQLIEMIARALSPSVNDPFTAINCLNWLYSALSVAANYKEGLQARQFGRVVFADLDFARLLQASLGKAYGYTQDDPIALARFLKILDQLGREVDNPEMVKSLRVFQAEIGVRDGG